MPQKGRWKENVYSPKKHSHSSDKPDTQQCQEFDLIPSLVGSLEPIKDVEDEELNFPSKHSQSVEDIHLPIAIRKGVRACTQHPITKIVSHDRLSTKFSAFTTTLTNIEIPRNIEEALADQKWKEVVLEEMGALERNLTWEVVELPRGKTTVDCKWVFTIKFNVDGSLIKQD